MFQRLYDTILDLLYMGEINMYSAIELIRAIKYEEEKLKHIV
jgi:hypothetical protein